MKIQQVRLRGIKCFEDTGYIEFSDSINILVGHNNSGKSTILSSIHAWQTPGARGGNSQRFDSRSSGYEGVFKDVAPAVMNGGGMSGRIQFSVTLQGDHPIPISGAQLHTTGMGNQIFHADFPRNPIVPFVAKRKAPSFDENVNLSTQQQVTGTFQNLYAKIDLVASYGTQSHEKYRKHIQSILGLFIGTKSSGSGKQAGYYFQGDSSKFVTLDQMGDGVAEIAAPVAELSLSSGKIFLLEEPETNLHPQGLKSLLSLIRDSSDSNQFIISTHSNIVLRELGAERNSKVFHVSRDGPEAHLPSRVSLVDNSTIGRTAVLRELGYEFGDLDLHEAWLFLEEASAEKVIKDILIPLFVPRLLGRLRTFSSAGLDNLELSVSQFQRMVSFVHLEPVYRDRMWIRADGGDHGEAIISRIRMAFQYLTEERANTFSQKQFEYYYPAKFETRVIEVLSISSKKLKAEAKFKLLQEVVEWTATKSSEEAGAAWVQTASEPIELLRTIDAELNGKSQV